MREDAPEARRRGRSVGSARGRGRGGLGGRALPRAGPSEPRPETLDDGRDRRPRPRLLPLPARRASLLTLPLPRLNGALSVYRVDTAGSRRLIVPACAVAGRDVILRSVRPRRRRGRTHPAPLFHGRDPVVRTPQQRHPAAAVRQPRVGIEEVPQAPHRRQGGDETQAVS